MSIRTKIALGAAAFLAAGALAGAASADSRAPCFFINQWEGWHASDANTLYLRVNLHDIYRVDLSAGSQELTWPGFYHLVSTVRGPDTVCGPLDLQLALSDGHGFYQPLIAKDIVKLTPDEVAALPKKDLP